MVDDIENIARYLRWEGAFEVDGRNGCRPIGLQVVLRALVVVIAHARTVRVREFGLSVRQLLEGGFRGGTDEASLALRGLQKLGFLEKRGRRQTQSTRYRLTLPSREQMDLLGSLDTPIVLPVVPPRSEADLERLRTRQAAQRERYGEFVQARIRRKHVGY